MSPTERQTHDLEHAPSRANDVRGGLETYEMDRPDKPPFYLTKAEVKLLGISGVCLPVHDICPARLIFTPQTGRILPRCL